MNDDPDFKLEPSSGRGEPMFRAPWPAVLLAGLIIAARAAHSLLGDDVWGQLLFSPADLASGQWVLLATNLLVFPDWPVAAFSAVFALAFATPTARWLGGGGHAAAGVGALYIVSGVTGTLAHALITPGAPTPYWAGAAAVAGLAGAASRFYGREGALGPIWSPMVLALPVAGLVLFLLDGALAGLEGGPRPMQGLGALAGFVAGVLLIGLFHPPRTVK